MRILAFLLLSVLASCSGRDSYTKSLKAVPTFKELETAFPGQFSVIQDSVSRVEFCPDNTCYSFESPKTTPPQELASFIYLYLSFSSEYSYIDSWRTQPETRIKAEQLLKGLDVKPCQEKKQSSETAACVLNFLMTEKRIELFNVRYDETERIADQVRTVSLAKNEKMVRSCRCFVEEFYNWYVPLAKKNSLEPAAIIAIRQRPSSFGEALKKALKDDYNAQKKAGEIVGIDFDPFLNSQDPATKYDIRKVVVQDGKCYAEIKSPGSKSATYDIRPELKLINAQWRFTNLHYNTDVSDLRDILSLLKSLKQDRDGK